MNTTTKDKAQEIKLTKKELNLILSALYVRYEESTENNNTLVGRLTNRLYKAKNKLIIKTK
tara:strand:- start:516 stop:698 length:183 start_codon:yes stop_codon:yes gene_type:complete